MVPEPAPGAAARHWLLLLGSSLPTDACLQRALVGLTALGEVRVATPVRRFPSYAGEPSRRYFNALAELATPLDRDALRTRLRALEAQLGRRRDVPGEVAIDLDLLAFADGTGWRADAHALAKGDLDHPTTRTLLALAGIDAIRRDV